MKTTLLLILLLSNLSSITYMQYYKIESTNTIKTNDNFVYENDSVKITYTFWANGGAMSFVLFNKMDKPLYIDWERSSMIVDATNQFYYNENLAGEGYTQKAMGFLPPKTQVKQSLSPIVTRNVSDWNNYETQYQVRNDSKDTQTKIFARHFSKDNSPVVFRNFLTLSDRVDFQTTFSIDNGFYIAEIQAMDVRNFRQPAGNDSWEFFYKKGTDFYLEK